MGHAAHCIGVFIICCSSQHFGYAWNDPVVKGDAPTTILAPDGGRAVIPCLVKLELENDSAVLVRWFRGNQTEPFYVLDSRTRRGGLSKGRHSRDEAWKGRSFFSVLQDPPSLKINRVYYEDRGIFLCDLLYASGRTHSTVVFLAVYDPPKEFSIKDINGDILDETAGPYTEGDDLLLNCEIVGGKPRFHSTWQNSLGAPMNVSAIEEGDMQKTFLRIQPLKRHHEGLNVTCAVATYDGLFERSLTVHVRLLFPPLTTEMVASHKELYFGEPAEFLCTTRGSRPPADIRWWFGAEPLEPYQYRTTSDANGTSSFVLVTPTKERNGERLKCTAFNKSLRGSEVSADVLLEVKYKPQVTLEFGAGLRESRIFEGHDIFFVCNASAYPSITDVVWEFNGFPVAQNDSNSGFLIVNQRYLVLRNVQSSDSGNYSCRVTNPEGVSTSKTLRLRIQHSPRCRHTQRHHYQIVYTTPFEEVSLACEVDADPSTNLSFRWSMKESHWGEVAIREATFARNFDNLARTHGSRSVLTFVPLPEELHSTFQCWARNEVGIQKKPCLFRLLPKEQPSTTRECLVLNKTHSSFFIECQRKSNDHHTFVLELRDASNNVLIKRIMSPSPRFHVSELEPGFHYTLLVYTTNGIENSSFLNITISSMRAAMPTTLNGSSDEQTTALGPILGPTVSCPLLLGLIILVVCYFKRRRRHEDKLPHQEMRSDGSEMFSIPLGAQRKVEYKHENIETVEVVTHYHKDVCEKLPLQMYGSVLL
ncbi:neural cell adhesion molecule 1-A-like [Ornithodoros turicata]|uniref:neural cell adhesion molecule 1-A-like n=1 Tax=Ornithodoros turicata TaxID=34597 RepID=UPI00313885D3